MSGTRRLLTIVSSLGILVIGSTAFAADIRGTVSSTLVITEDSQLVGDVTCTVSGAPCIAFGASGIALRLNGFTLAGLAHPVTACSGSNNTVLESGIEVSNQRGVVIQGPGKIDRFRSSGIRVNMSTRVLVTQVTASTNCAAGIWVIGGSDHEIVNNTFSRNGNVTFPCGGI